VGRSIEGYFALVPVALTCLAIAFLEARRQSHAAASLRTALSKALEAVGMTVLFFLGNVATGAVLTVAARALDVTFISIYLSADVALLVLSLLQALIYQRWREARASAARSD
jgi:hypothetical protein